MEREREWGEGMGRKERGGASPPPQYFALEPSVSVRSITSGAPGFTRKFLSALLS